MNQIFIIFVKTVKKWGNLARFEVFSCKSGILSKIWDPSTSKSKISKIRKNTIVKISKINFYIYKSTPKKFGPNRRSGTHFLKSLLFGQNLLVFFKFSQNFNLQSIKLNKRSKFPPNPVSNVAKYHWASLKYLGFMAKSVF